MLGTPSLQQLSGNYLVYVLWREHLFKQSRSLAHPTLHRHSHTPPFLSLSSLWKSCYYWNKVKVIFLVYLALPQFLYYLMSLLIRNNVILAKPVFENYSWKKSQEVQLHKVTYLQLNADIKASQNKQTCSIVCYCIFIHVYRGYMKHWWNFVV